MQESCDCCGLARFLKVLQSMVLLAVSLLDKKGSIGQDNQKAGHGKVSTVLCSFSGLSGRFVSVISAADKQGLDWHF